jgi:hypothetical protein
MWHSGVTGARSSVDVAAQLLAWEIFRHSRISGEFRYNYQR